MRLDHSSNAAAANANANAGQVQRQRSPGGWDPPPSIIRVRSPTLRVVPTDSASDEEEEEDAEWARGYESGAQTDSAAVADDMRETTQSDSEEEVYEHMLFCGGGGEEKYDDEWEDRRPSPPPAWEPSPLPLYPPPSPSPSRPRFSIHKPHKRNNGCGALIHMRASPRRRQAVWMAKSEAMDSVVTMDSAYFDRKAVAKMLRSACGCVREGVGCAIW